MTNAQKDLASLPANCEASISRRHRAGENLQTMLQALPPVVTTETRRDNALRMLKAVCAPLTHENLFALAQRYEATYRRHRASKNPPHRSALVAQLNTARAFHSLARAAR